MSSFQIFGVLLNVGGEEFGTFRGVEVDDLDTSRVQPVQATGEVTGFTDDDGAEAKLADEATAIPTGCKSADDDKVAIGALSSGAAEGVVLALFLTADRPGGTIIPAIYATGSR